MDQNVRRSKLKPRFNKFDTSESPIQTSNLEISSDVPTSLKRPIEGIQTIPNRNMCYNVMHPPSSTANLANNRLQKLRQSLQIDLKNRKNCQSDLNKDDENHKIKCLTAIDSKETETNATTSGNGKNEMNTPGCDKASKSFCHDVATPTSTSVLLNCNSASRPYKLNHRSPLLEERINCKRKLSESPLTPDESTAAKKLHFGRNLHRENVPQVKAPATNETNSCKSKLSARLLKIKTKTDKINSSLTSLNCSNLSDQLHEYKSNSCTPNSDLSLHKYSSYDSTPNKDNSFQISKSGETDNRLFFNDSDTTNRENNISKYPISQRSKVNQRAELNTTSNLLHETIRKVKSKSSLQKRRDRGKLEKNLASLNSIGINRGATSSTSIFNKESVNKTLSEELISAHNSPLLHNGNDPLDDKMAMTASWIQNHQRYNPVYKVTDSEEPSSTTNVGPANGEEEMEWTNAEPDSDQDIAKVNENSLIVENSQKNSKKFDPEKKEKRLCIIVDTNVFISDLSKIHDIINLKVTGPLQPLLYIPWMVITELDEMKDRPGNSALKQKVCNAIKCINKLLSEENPRIKGQTICDMNKQIHVGAAQDDKIIGTCLQATEKYESVMLLSNDVNLKNKALINNIAVSSAREVIMKIMSRLVKNTKYQKIKQKMGMLCSSVICESAKEAYGDDVWMKMDMLSNPPWSFAECMKRFRKYWCAVFQQKLMKQFLQTVNNIQQLLDDESAYIADDSDKYREFVKLSLNLCIFLKDIEEYKGYIENTIKDIVKIG